MTRELRRFDKCFYMGKNANLLYKLWTVTDIHKRPNGDTSYEMQGIVDGKIETWETESPNLLEFVYNSAPKYAEGDIVCFFPWGVTGGDFFVRGVVKAVQISLTNAPNTYTVEGLSIYRPTDAMKYYRESLFSDARTAVENELAEKYSTNTVSEKDLFQLRPTADSTVTTLKHIRRVAELLNNFAVDLINRGSAHDNSKLEVPEKLFLDEMQYVIDNEGQAPYGSEAYKRNTAILKPMLQHHYSVNSHHPENHKNWIYGMTLMDIVEMSVDWVAASERGNESFVNLTAAAERYNMSEQLKDIFANTYNKLGIRWK